MVHDLGDEFLAFFELNQSLNCELDVFTITDLGEVVANIAIVEEDLLEHVVESFDDIKVALLERLVQL